MCTWHTVLFGVVILERHDEMSWWSRQTQEFLKKLSKVHLSAPYNNNTPKCIPAPEPAAPWKKRNEKYFGAEGSTGTKEDV
jgi:hypothetical protein